MKETKCKAHCEVCNREIYDSVDPAKIITCAHCVIILMDTPREEKVRFKDSLLSKNLPEAARCVDSFIIPEQGTDLATFKRTAVSRATSQAQSRFKPGLKRLSREN